MTIIEPSFRGPHRPPMPASLFFVAARFAWMSVCMLVCMQTVCVAQSRDAAQSAQSAGATAPDPRARAREYFGEHALTDQDGNTRRFYSDLLQGRVVLINVVFTNCPSACPMMTERLKQVRKQLGEDFGRDVYFLSLSVDPARDTPEALKRFAERHRADAPGWRFLVADPQTMKALLGRLGQWSDSPDDHTTLLIAGNASKAHWAKLRPDAPPEQIAAELARLK
jgi:protein SCO1